MIRKLEKPVHEIDHPCVSQAELMQHDALEAKQLAYFCEVSPSQSALACMAMTACSVQASCNPLREEGHCAIDIITQIFAETHMLASVHTSDLKIRDDFSVVQCCLHGMHENFKPVRNY